MDKLEVSNIEQVSCKKARGKWQFLSSYADNVFIGMYGISLFQIRPEPDLAGFVSC